jgi:proteasome lid subunit RPN8/RPN11
MARNEKRTALIVATSRYKDEFFRQLIGPPDDAKALSRVLADPSIGNFAVNSLLNEYSHRIDVEIESFFADRSSDDILLLYFSGHGMKDEDGKLYFGTTDTKHKLLRSTAIAASFVNDVMLRSRSRTQILLLDCCFSGAFARGMIAKGEVDESIRDQLEGVGRVVLTASDAMQYSYEGDIAEGSGVPSVFTRAVVDGLQSGAADLNGDGLIDMDELYQYVYKRVVDITPHQKPCKFVPYSRGEIIIARNPQPTLKINSLPEDLRNSLKDRRPWVRFAAVQELDQLVRHRDPGLALAAREALMRLSTNEKNLDLVRAVEICVAKGLEWQELEQQFGRQKNAMESAPGREYRRLNLTQNHIDTLRKYCAQEIPNMSCGALIGYSRSRDEIRELAHVLPLQNARTDAPRARCSITPESFRNAEEDARRRGMDLLGWYHSNPGYPARPSEFDRVHAWPWYSNVIIGAENDIPGDITSWVLEDDRSRFNREPIEIVGP